MGGWDDRGYYEEEAARDAFIEETLKGISHDGVSGYLGTYGDAIDGRVQTSIDQAQQLLKAGFAQSSLVLATTAIEVIVRFLLIHPLVQAAFLSEDWAYLLTQRVASGRTAEDRQLLPKILEFHDIDISTVLLKNKKPLWATVLATVYPMRNKAVHSAEPITVDEAVIALECATLLRSDVVLPLATKCGFTLETTGRWHTTRTENRSARYNPRDPFKRENR